MINGIRHETHEVGRRTHRPKRWEYNNEDEDKSLNTLRDDNLKWLLKIIYTLAFETSMLQQLMLKS